MSEYIELKKRCVYAGDVIAELLKGGMELDAAILFANNLPTADVVEVKHGRWERIGENYENCTNCGTIFEALPTQYVFEANNKYCRNCGAKMDGE